MDSDTTRVWLLKCKEFIVSQRGTFFIPIDDDRKVKFSNQHIPPMENPLEEELPGNYCFIRIVSRHKLSFARCPRILQPAVWSSTTWKQDFYDHHAGKVDESQPRTQVEESKEDFKYVERLIPSLEIPSPPKQESYPTPSGWSPPKEPEEGTPYYVRRTRYHQLPVYIKQKHGGTQIWTIIKNVDGDIWTLAENLLKHLEEYKGAEVGMSINEYTKRVVYKGLFDEPAKEWLTVEGF